MNERGGTAVFQPLLIATSVSILLVLLFLVTIRNGHFASPGARGAALVAIAVVAILVWFGAGLVFGR